MSNGHRAKDHLVMIVEDRPDWGPIIIKRIYFKDKDKAMVFLEDFAEDPPTNQRAVLVP